GKCRSEPQRPQWLTSISRSFGPGVGVGRSSTATSLRPMNTAAGMTAGTSVIAMTKGSPKPDTGVNLSQPTPSHGASEHAYGAQCPQLMGAGATTPVAAPGVGRACWEAQLCRRDQGDPPMTADI